MRTSAARVFAASQLAALLLVLGGCGLAQSHVRLSVPPGLPQPSEPAAAPGPSVSIRSVVDDRVFQDSFAELAIPSVGHGSDAAALRPRAIGRKGVPGVGMGVVVLDAGQTVATVLRDNVAAALTRAGYHVAAASTDDGTALWVDVRIRELWSWAEDDGHFRFTIRAVVATDIVIEDRPAPLTVAVEWSRLSFSTNDNSWNEIWDGTLHDYRNRLVERLNE